MDTSQEGTPSDEQNNLQVQVHLKEYEQLRAEIIQYLSSQDQRIVLALGSASVAIPLLVGQTGNLPTTIVASLLYALSIVYAVIGMNYAGGLYTIATISRYIHEHIEQELNRVVNPSSVHTLLQWESFLRQERKNVLTVILSGIGTIGSTLLLLLPGTFALLAAQYVLLVPPTQMFQENAALKFISSLLTPLSLLAWCFYILALLSFVVLAVRLKSLTLQ